jgi:CheY-like chemotaxis protein
MIYETKHFNAGDYIIKEGEMGKGFYILEEGELEVVRSEKVLNEINLKGAMFGELSELLMAKRDASIRAKTNASVKFFDMGLHTFVEENPKFAVKMIRNLGRRLSRMNAVAIQGNTRNDILKSISASFSTEKEGQKVRILVVDDKPMIIEQIKGFAEEPGWLVEGTGDIASAVSLSESQEYNAFIISSSLPEDGAIELRRKLKSNSKFSNVPVVAMVIKGDDSAVKRATDSGFSHIIFKPLEKNKVSTVLYDVLELDASDQYFDLEENVLLFRVPKITTTELLEDIKDSYSGRLHSTINDGIENIVIDLSEIDEAGEDSVELVGEFAELIEEMGSPFRLGFVFQGEDAEMWKNLDGCEEAEIFESIEDAKNQMT